MHIFNYTFKPAKIISSNSLSQQNHFNNSLKILSTDQVTFKGSIAQGSEEKTSLDKNLTDKILKLFEKYNSFNLEFVNNRNEMVFSLKLMQTNGNFYITELQYNDDGIRKFDSAMVNKYYYMDQDEVKRLFPSYPPNNFTILDSGRISHIMFCASSPETTTFDNLETLQYTENILTNILSGIDSNNLTVFNGKIDSASKPYDDFNSINENKSHFKRAYNVLLQNKHGVLPSYKEISDLISRFEAFRLKGSLALQQRKQREKIKNVSDDAKYKIALDKQREKQQKEKQNPVPNPLSEVVKNANLPPNPQNAPITKPKAKVYMFKPREKD